MIQVNFNRGQFVVYTCHVATRDDVQKLKDFARENSFQISTKFIAPKSGEEAVEAIKTYMEAVNSGQ